LIRTQSGYEVTSLLMVVFVGNDNYDISWRRADEIFNFINTNDYEHEKIQDLFCEKPILIGIVNNRYKFQFLIRMKYAKFY
jgi:hypothetical protein